MYCLPSCKQEKETLQTQCVWGTLLLQAAPPCCTCWPQERSSHQGKELLSQRCGFVPEGRGIQSVLDVCALGDLQRGSRMPHSGTHVLPAPSGVLPAVLAAASRRARPWCWLILLNLMLQIISAICREEFF